MGANKVKVTGFRIEDETILMKLSIIATKNCRTRNKEVEYILKQYVTQYESIHGEIKLETKEETKTTKNSINTLVNSGNVIVGDNGTINM